MPLPVSMDATWLNGSVSFNAQELRRADASIFGGDGSAFGVRGGIVLHSDTSLGVSVSAADVVTIQPGAVVIPGNSGVGNGCYRAALGAAETGNLAVRNATNPRIDLVIFRALDTDVVGTHAAFTGRIEILTGVAAASPVAPALPSMAVELARITVPPSGGPTATVDGSFRRFASAIGGRLTVASAGALPISATKWQEAVALDTGVDYLWDGAAWEGGAEAVVPGPNVNSSSTSVYRRGGLVVVNISITASANLALNAELFTMPYRPPVLWYVTTVIPGANPEDTRRIHLRETDGVAVLQDPVNSGNILRGSVCFPV
jgi:hypothetical protein